MESMVVYLGSDHVIKTPDFDFRKNSLRVSTTFEDAKQQAHKKVGIGVVSVYQLNLWSTLFLLKTGRAYWTALRMWISFSAPVRMCAACPSVRSGHSKHCPFLRQPSRANQFHMYWRPGSPRSRLFQWGTQQYIFSDGSVPQEWISSFSLSRLQCAQGKEVNAILQSSTKAVAN